MCTALLLIGQSDCGVSHFLCVGGMCLCSKMSHSPLSACAFLHVCMCRCVCACHVVKVVHCNHCVVFCCCCKWWDQHRDIVPQAIKCLFVTQTFTENSRGSLRIQMQGSYPHRCATASSHRMNWQNPAIFPCYSPLPNQGAFQTDASRCIYDPQNFRITMQVVQIRN